MKNVYYVVYAFIFHNAEALNPLPNHNRLRQHYMYAQQGSLNIAVKSFQSVKRALKNSLSIFTTEYPMFSAIKSFTKRNMKKAFQVRGKSKRWKFNFCSAICLFGADMMNSRALLNVYELNELCALFLAHRNTSPTHLSQRSSS